MLIIRVFDVSLAEHDTQSTRTVLMILILSERRVMEVKARL